MDSVKMHSQLILKMFSARIVSLALSLLPSFTWTNALAQNISGSDTVKVTEPSIVMSVTARYPAGSIQSLEIADRILIEINQERASIDAIFKQQQLACSARFFSTMCLDDVKENRRLEMSKIRDLEVQVNTYKRRMRVVERDKALAVMVAKDFAK